MNQTGTRRIRAGLPPGTPLAHNTGNQYRRVCDFGILFMPADRHIVFSCCVKNAKSHRAAENIVARLANRAYWHLTPAAERKGRTSKLLPIAEKQKGSEPIKQSAGAADADLFAPPKRKSDKREPRF